MAGNITRRAGVGGEVGMGVQMNFDERGYIDPCGYILLMHNRQLIDIQ